jgi:RHS repeat-associated protein
VLSLELTNSSGSSIIQINPFKCKWYYYDVETQLFYCNSRYYSPELCRFISPDSIEYLDPQSINGLNLYCYCINNPVI